MAQPPREPEMWIEQDPGTGAGGRPHSTSQPTRPGRLRWIGLVLGFTALVAMIAVQHFAGSSPNTDRIAGTPAPVQPTVHSQRATAAGSPAPGSASASTSVQRTAHTRPVAPGTVNVGAPVLPSNDWELVALQWSGTLGHGPSAVIRYDGESGALTTTPLPDLASNGPLSFIATGGAAIIRPLDRVPGYTISRGDGAVAAGGALGTALRLFPPADDGTFWAAATSEDALWLEHLAPDGSPLGQRVPVTSTMARDGLYSLTPDGGGFVLASGIGGTYQIRGDGPHLVTRGKVIAAGPAGWLTLDCDHAASCATITVDRASGQRTLLRLTDFAADEVPLQGVMSANGRFAAVLDTSRPAAALVLIDLASGAVTAVATELHGMYLSDTAPVTAFTTDNKLLLVCTPAGILPIDTETGDAQPLLPLPPLAALFVLPRS